MVNKDVVSNKIKDLSVDIDKHINTFRSTSCLYLSKNFELYLEIDILKEVLMILYDRDSDIKVTSVSFRLKQNGMFEICYDFIKEAYDIAVKSK